MLTVIDVYKGREQQIETPLAHALKPGPQAECRRDRECSPSGLPGLLNGGNEALSKTGDSGRKNKDTYRASFNLSLEALFLLCDICDEILSSSCEIISFFPGDGTKRGDSAGERKARLH